MAVREDARQTMTVDEWRALEQASHDIKHEYIDGHVYAMSGGALSHGRLGSNAAPALEDALAATGQTCYVYNSDAAARLSSKRYTYPDASVTCDERDRPSRDKTEVEAPRLIVEALSDSTEAYDRGRKFRYYRACLHVQEYVLVSTKYQAVEVYRRALQVWTYQAYGPGDDMELPSIGVRVSVAAFYRDAGVPEETDDPEGEV